MPRRSDDSERVGLCSMVRARSSSKLAKLAGPLTKLVIGAAFSAFTPGVMSTRTRARTSSGACAASAMDDMPPSDMPTTPRASGASSATTAARSGRCCRPRPSPRARRRSGRARAGPRPGAAARAPARRCPRCGRSAPRRGRGRARGPGSAPQTRLETRRPGDDLDVDPAHVGRPVEGEAVLGGVLVEQPELVVGDQLRHATQCPIRTPGGPAG